MQPDRFTIKTQEAVQAAISLAHQRRNPQATPEHLLLALLEQEGGVVAPVLAKLGADAAADRAPRSTPRWTPLPTLGAGGEAAGAASELVQVLRAAEHEMRDAQGRVRLHRARAARAGRPPLAGRRRAARAPARTKDALRRRVAEVRGPHRVTDPERRGQVPGAREVRPRPHRRPPTTASSTRSSAATTRSAASSRSSRAARRTTRS